MDRLKRALEAGKILPIYVVHGTEDLLKREMLKVICNAALQDSPKEFNETRLVWKETDAHAVVDACRTFPMMGPKRLVLVSGLDKAKSADLEPLTAYAKDPSPTSVLVLTATAIDGRLAFYKAVKKVGEIHKLTAPYTNKIPSWLAARAREKGVRIEGAATHMLAEILGNDLAKLDDALERLILYAARPGESQVSITQAHVDASIARAREHTIFELTDALGRRQAADALQILDAMLEARESEVRIVAMIARHLRRLWQAKDALRQGQSPEEVGGLLRVHQFFLRDFLRQAQMFEDRDYGWLLDRVYATDKALKSSRAPSDLLLHGLILDVCAGAGTVRRPAPN